MKRILVFCSLYFLASLSYAETCPSPRNGYFFSIAAWGNHVNPTSPVRCHYYNYIDRTAHYEYVTSEWYSERDMQISWSNNEYLYKICQSHNKDVNECSFSHK